MTHAPAARPGRLLILIPLSDGMAVDGPTAGGLPPAAAAALLADTLIDGLVAAGDGAASLDVGVYGYAAGVDADGVRLESLLGDDPGQARPVPVAGLAGRPAVPREDGQPRQWVRAAVGTGPAPAAAALAEAYQMVAGRSAVVVHCTDGGGCRTDYLRVARSLAALDGVRLAHCGFAPDDTPPTLPTPGGPAGSPWADLAGVSSPLPPADGRAAGVAAVSVNDWPVAELWDLLFPPDKVVDPDDPPPDGSPTADPDASDSPDDADPTFVGVRSARTAKLGNAPDECEDAFAVDPVGGMAAIADGASEGIFCRAWAALLSDNYLTDRPDAGSPPAFARWVAGCRTVWRTAINYPDLRWSQQNKVGSTGAAATLLGLTVGPADETGVRPWRAAAVGDSCLFWVRDGRLHATFPVAAGGHLDSNPGLVRTLVRPDPARPVVAAGVCRPGDRFLLATDAVSAWLFGLAADPDRDWDRVADGDPDWAATWDDLRQSGRLVNDDCALVALSVACGTGVRPPPEVESSEVGTFGTDAPQPETSSE